MRLACSEEHEGRFCRKCRDEREVRIEELESELASATRFTFDGPGGRYHAIDDRDSRRWEVWRIIKGRSGGYEVMRDKDRVEAIAEARRLSGSTVSPEKPR